MKKGPDRDLRKLFQSAAPIDLKLSTPFKCSLQIIDISNSPSDAQEPPAVTPLQPPSPPTERPSSWDRFRPVQTSSSWSQFWLSLGLQARIAEARRRRQPTIPIVIGTRFVDAICGDYFWCF